MIAASGTIETVTIALPTRGENVTYFFGIIAADEVGNAGDLSNLVSASLEFIPPLVTEPVPMEPVEPDTRLEPWAIGLIAGLSTVLFILVTAIVCFMVYAKNSSEKKVDDQPDSSYPNAQREGKVIQVPNQPNQGVYDNSAYLA